MYSYPQHFLQCRPVCVCVRVCATGVFVCSFVVSVLQPLTSFILYCCVHLVSVPFPPLCLLLYFFQPPVCMRVCTSLCCTEESRPSGVEPANVVWKELQSMLCSQWPLSRWEPCRRKTPQVPQHPLCTAGGCCCHTLHSSCSAARTKGTHQSLRWSTLKGIHHQHLSSYTECDVYMKYFCTHLYLLYLIGCYYPFCYRVI